MLKDVIEFMLYAKMGKRTISKFCVEDDDVSESVAVHRLGKKRGL